MFAAKIFAGAGDAGKYFLRGYACVGQTFDFVEANIAGLAVGLGKGLAEIFGQLFVAAMHATTEMAHMLEQLTRWCDHLSAFFRFQRAFFDQQFPAQYIGGGVEQHTFSLQAVAAGSAGFLLVVLDGFRHGGVDDAAHVAAIDAHAEGHGGGDHVERFRGKVLLGAAPIVGFHAGVIVGGAQAAGLQPARH